MPNYVAVREATEKNYEGICKLFDSEEELLLIYPPGEYPFTTDQRIELASGQRINRHRGRCYAKIERK